MYVLTEREILAGIFGAVGLVVPIVVAMSVRARRQKAIMDQLPSMAEEMARCARSGRNLDHAFMLVASDTPSPLVDELRISARRMEMGIDIGSAVQDLAARTGVSTMTMLSSALAVHQDTGGDRFRFWSVWRLLFVTAFTSFHVSGLPRLRAGWEPS